MGLNYEYVPGQTPLDEDEKEGLRIPLLATRHELDEFEQNNIEDAMLWLAGKRLSPEVIFSENFSRSLHKRMFNEVWKWAGTFRKSNKNLGVDKWQITTELHILCADAHYWVQHSTFTPDEIAIRFKHRIVSIHCFPNGNGRHSRLMADVIADKIFKHPVFTWGAANFVHKNNARERYINALRKADTGDYSPLLEFARS